MQNEEAKTKNKKPEEISPILTKLDNVALQQEKKENPPHSQMESNHFHNNPSDPINMQQDPSNPRIFKPLAASTEIYPPAMPYGCYPGNPNQVPLGLLNQIAQLQQQQAYMQNLLKSYGIAQQNPSYMQLMNSAMQKEQGNVSKMPFAQGTLFGGGQNPLIAPQMMMSADGSPQQYPSHFINPQQMPQYNPICNPQTGTVSKHREAQIQGDDHSPIKSSIQHGKPRQTVKRARGLENLIKVAVESEKKYTKISRTTEKTTVVSIPFTQSPSTLVKLSMTPAKEIFVNPNNSKRKKNEEDSEEDQEEKDIQ